MKVILNIRVEADLADSDNKEGRTPDEVAAAAKTVVERVITVAFRGCGLSIATSANAEPTLARKAGQ